MTRGIRFRRIALGLTACLALGLHWAGGVAIADEWPWLDRSRAAGERARLMVGQMTLEEKSALLYGYGTREIGGEKWQVYVRGNARLGIPDMVQGDLPAGIWQGSNDVTQLPASIALGATFSREAARSYGHLLGRETRALGYGVIHGPNVDVQRDPRHGRAHETFGEDPWLTSAIGTQYVLGVQENAVMADAKHFAVNTVEQDRRSTDARLSRKVLEELYLFPFQDVIEDAHVAMVMCAYTQINGVHACNDETLLQDVLRKRLGFEGIVRTDAGAEHSLRSLSLGVDQEFRSEKYYGKDLIAAVTKGDFPERDVDAAVVRILTAMIRYENLRRSAAARRRRSRRKRAAGAAHRGAIDRAAEERPGHPAAGPLDAQGRGDRRCGRRPAHSWRTDQSLARGQAQLSRCHQGAPPRCKHRLQGRRRSDHRHLGRARLATTARRRAARAG